MPAALSQSATRDRFSNPITRRAPMAGSDILARCSGIAQALSHPALEGTHGGIFRMLLTSGLDARVQAIDPRSGLERTFLCFDSNSYLGLHKHPDVLQAVRKVLGEAGYGTPSAQLMCGTNIHLRRLEETVAAFHERDDCMVFPSGFAAAYGVLTALVGAEDTVLLDRFSHASLHDGARASGARCVRFRHRDHAHLDRRVRAGGDSRGGTLIATDGVFSMHGTLAPLAELREVATRHRATLLVDEAHSVGIIGPHGRGLEDAAGLPGAIDILVGTFSKAAGSLGGYVCGSRDLITCLRFKARSGVFTAALPAAICAGLTQAFRIMERCSEHRERLLSNVRLFATALEAAGVTLAARAVTPILTIPVGDTDRLLTVAWALLERGIKCGVVDYPAVPAGHGILRLAVNARHTPEDLERTAEALAIVLSQVPGSRS